MTFVWGGTLAAGILLVMSPWMWPPQPGRVRPAVSGRAARLLAAAGFARVPPRSLGAATVALALVAASVAWLITALPALAFVAGAAGAAAPLVWVRARAARRRRGRRALWPDICDLLIASVRAGMSLPDAVASLAQSAPAELRPAFTVFARDLDASGHFDSAVQRLKHTLADPVADRIVETLRMTRQVGGTELPTVLRALSASVRADAALRAEVEARQSWIRGAATLGVIAPWVILGLLALRPEGARAYGTAEGVVVVLAGAAISVVAYRIMVQIGRLPEPRRWFG
ncbi:type II secretion system F family protein [Microbacterium sp. zg.Y1090]|uniref:type II secretion system F family protein n=1 Tax=Microbacterium TaxID=33882 RepID=UPI00214CFBBD|nr:MULTISPECIES: type II secretion system F family protein [unclassified Microbacterium]MCR2811509.1 type II secretion system F family protein [Microbacterium sp. zg.Y1084]MCR2819072.1 type II secretion system F family protein [Microbacterium sp. zg.Y1090]WIM27375.1 type II secretion system F family protein [Microbacterium sp. zg-Y1090]